MFPVFIQCHNFHWIYSIFLLFSQKHLAVNPDLRFTIPLILELRSISPSLRAQVSSWVWGKIYISIAINKYIYFLFLLLNFAKEIPCELVLNFLLQTGYSNDTVGVISASTVRESGCGHDPIFRCDRTRPCLQRPQSVCSLQRTSHGHQHRSYADLLQRRKLRHVELGYGQDSDIDHKQISCKRRCKIQFI